jgi:flagella basal body P-ring formation protein FlgA
MRVLSVERQRVGLSRIIVEARSESGEVEQLTLVGTLDEFMYMPVASRQLSVGNVVSFEDVVMARLDTKSLPRDVASTRDGIVGHAVKRTLSTGDFFRSPDLVLPHDITAGSSVTIKFSGRGFTATATGSALEGGRRGGKIRVRNEISKRILQGTIVEPGLVEVQ